MYGQTNYSGKIEHETLGIEYTTKYHQSEREMFRLQEARARRTAEMLDYTAANVPDAPEGMILLAGGRRALKATG